MRLEGSREKMDSVNGLPLSISCIHVRMTGVYGAEGGGANRITLKESGDSNEGRGNLWGARLPRSLLFSLSDA